MSAIYILWLREMKRYVRSFAHVLASVGQPILFFAALGLGFGPIFRESGRGNYMQFIAPGVIGMSILYTSVLSGVPLILDRQLGSLKGALVSPVPRYRIALGRILGGATVALSQGVIVILICFSAGFRPANLGRLPLALFFMALIAFAFTALGNTIGSLLGNVQIYPLVMNFITMPIFFFSGALFPLSTLPGVLKVATRLNPLSYGVDGLRTALIGISSSSLFLDAAVLVAVAGLLMLLASYFFSRIQI
jgi:ABC-2 type transport system permease protein